MNKMDSVELLTVTDHFDISNVGLVLAPDFDTPPQGKWSNFSEDIIVVTPDGQEHKHKANFSLIHFNIRDPQVSVNRRWRIVVSLPSANKESVPVGSKVLVSKTTKQALLEGGNA